MDSFALTQVLNQLFKWNCFLHLCIYDNALLDIHLLASQTLGFSDGYVLKGGTQRDKNLKSLKVCCCTDKSWMWMWKLSNLSNFNLINVI